MIFSVWNSRGLVVLVNSPPVRPSHRPYRFLDVLANDFYPQFEFREDIGRPMQFRKMARWEFNGSTHHPGRVICRCTKTCEAGSGSVSHPK